MNKSLSRIYSSQRQESEENTTDINATDMEIKVDPDSAQKQRFSFNNFLYGNTSDKAPSASLPQAPVPSKQEAPPKRKPTQDPRSSSKKLKAKGFPSHFARFLHFNL
jgi:hypothetical protein